MMQWLSEIFESTSDQARLVTTLIAATIAICVVLLNQWYNSRRAKKDKLIEKIEETYSVIIRILELRLLIHNRILDEYPEQSAELFNYHEEFLRETAKAEMLSGLYFPNLTGLVEELRMNYDFFYEGYLSSEELKEYIDHVSPYCLKIDNISSAILKQLSIAMKKHIR